jgi:hypothetical protein
VLVDILREKAQEETRKYGERPDVKNLVMWISKIYEIYTRYEGVRPFGTALLVGGIDANGFHLYETDPSGVFQKRKATAIGKGAQKALEILESRYREDLTRDEAVKLTLEILNETVSDRPQDDQKGEEIHILTREGFLRMDLDERAGYEEALKMLAGKSPAPPGAKKPKKGRQKKEGAGILEFLDSVPRLSKEGKDGLKERFGDLDGLKKAYFDELMSVKGVGKASAERIIKALKDLREK